MRSKPYMIIITNLHSSLGKFHKCCDLQRRPFPLPQPTRRGGPPGPQSGGDPGGDPGSSGRLGLWQKYHHAAD